MLGTRVGSDQAVGMRSSSVDAVEYHNFVFCLKTRSCILVVFPPIVSNAISISRGPTYQSFHVFQSPSYFVGINSDTGTTNSTKSSSMTYKEWSDSLSKADGTKVNRNYATVNEVKAEPEKTGFVEVKDVKILSSVVYDNPPKQEQSSTAGSVVHIQRNPRDGSYYMHSDGQVRYVFRK